MANATVNRDFSKATLAKLARLGIEVLSTTLIPGAGDLPFATGSRGYSVADNGVGKVWTFSQVLGATA
jgi:hypothetical protein